MSNEKLEPNEQESAMLAPPLVTNATSSKVLYSDLVSSREYYNGSTSIALGTVQVVGGVLCIICQGFQYTVFSLANFVSAGIWCGLMVSQVRHREKV